MLMQLLHAHSTTVLAQARPTMFCIRLVIGASVSEPHIDEFNVNFLYFYISIFLYIFLYIQVAELASLAQLLPPCSPTVRNPAPDSSLCSRSRPLRLLLPDCVRFNCCSPIASASTAAPRLRPLQLLLARLRPLQLLLPDCVRFNCCSPASTAAPRLHTSAACWIPPQCWSSSRFSE